MKKILIPLVALCGMLAVGASAQQSNAGESFEAEIAREAKDWAVEIREEKPNEIKIGYFTYSGIFLEALKADNLLQLLNPFAPPEYGSSEDNLVLDPITSKVVGLKFFSLQF
jgi:CRISPR/Cas system-associated protein Cas5 (RAMP superfamily)